MSCWLQHTPLWLHSSPRSRQATRGDNRSPGRTNLGRARPDKGKAYRRTKAGGEALPPAPPPRCPGPTHLLHPLFLRPRAARGLRLRARVRLGARLWGWRLGPGPSLGRRGHGGAAQALRGRKAAGGARAGPGPGEVGRGRGGDGGRPGGWGAQRGPARTGREGFGVPPWGAPLVLLGPGVPRAALLEALGVCSERARALLRHPEVSRKCVLVSPAHRPPPRLACSCGSWQVPGVWEGVWGQK